MNDNLSHNNCTAFNKGTIGKLTRWQKFKLYFMKNIWEAQNGKCCPRCGNKELGIMNSLRLRFCANCHYWFKAGSTK